MKKLLSLSTILILSLFGYAYANTFVIAPSSISKVGAPYPCPLGAKNFCQCWATVIVNGCKQQMPDHQTWCTIPNIIASVELEGIPKACTNDPVCEAEFNSYINNNPPNNPHCPI